MQEVTTLYRHICKPPHDGEDLDRRAQIVRRLEQITNSDFKSTSDFHHKMGAYLAKKESPGLKLQAARKNKGWSQVTLGHFLGVSQQHVAQMEKNIRPLIPKALEFAGT